MLAAVLLLAVTVLSGLPVQSAPQKRPLRVWFSSFEQENKALREIAGRFTRETGIEVEVVSSNFFDIASKLPGIAETDEKPDLVFMQSTDVGVLAGAGYLKPLDFLEPSLLDVYDDVGKNGFKYQDELYGLGYSVDTYGLLYNKALVKEPPKTWDELFALADALTVMDNGQVVQYGLLLNAKNLWFTYPLLEEYGGYYFGENADGSYDTQDLGLDSPGMLSGIQKLLELQEKHMVLPLSSQSDSHIVSYFADGKVAMTLYGLWSADIFVEKGIDYGIAELPVSQRTGQFSKPLSTVQGFVINNHTELMPEAEAFYEYIYQSENQLALYMAANGGDARNGTRNTCNTEVASSDYVTSSEILSSLYRVGRSSRVFPNVPEGPLLWNYSGTVMNSIFYPEDGKSPDTAKIMTEFQERIAADMASMHQELSSGRSDQLLYYGAAAVVAVLVVACVISYVRKRRRCPYMPRTKRLINIIAWLGLMPLLLMILLFYIYPILHNLYLSLTNYSSMHLKDYKYVGLANYREIFTGNFDGFVGMFIWTVSFALLVVCFAFILGVLLAVLLDQVQVTVSKGFRLIFILPWVVPTVITLLMWQGLLDTGEGLINQILGIFHIPAIPWLTNPVVAKASSVFVMVWFSFPYYMVVAQGILKSIPGDYYEAARMDGAGRRVCFWRLTLPIVFRSILPTLVMGFIMQFNQFGVYLLTQGGPAAERLGAPGATDLLITYVFNTAFNTRQYGLAAAYSVIIFIFVAIFAMTAMGVGRRSGKRGEA